MIFSTNKSIGSTPTFSTFHSLLLCHGEAARVLPYRPWLCLSALILFSTFFFPHSHGLKLGQNCVADRNCDAGLHCETCVANGNVRPRCTRVQPISPASQVKGLPFNRYSWLTTHNSFALMGHKNALGVLPITPTNQQDSITSQLQNGVRGFMLDMYDFLNDIWLCHSFGGQCYNLTAFQPAINVLKEMQVFLDANPNEIITIFIEDYVTSSQGLTHLFNAAGLRKFWFPVSRMPKNGGDWPTIDDMIRQNQRLVVFTSKSAKEASEGIAYQWRYTVENQYGNGGRKAGSCPNRAESPTMNTKSRSLIVQNYFRDNPNFPEACRDNSAALMNMTKTCYDAAGKRWPNYIAVDFYKRSDGEGSAGAVDAANGQLVCGCSNIAYCEANAAYGVCNTPEAPRSPLPSRQGTSADEDSGAPFQRRPSTSWLMFLVTLMMSMLSF